MAEVFKFILPFFFTPKDYAQMLRQLAVSVFWEVYIASFLLRDLQPIEEAFRAAETHGQLGAAIAAIPHAEVLNIAGFAIAFLTALLTFVARFHDRISDVLGIRRRFDRDKILLPLAQLVGAELTDAQKARLMSARHRIMREVFYRYASSRAEEPLVDKHDIEHALGAWFWFWFLEEASVHFFVDVDRSVLFWGTWVGMVLRRAGHIVRSPCICSASTLGSLCAR